MSLKPQRKAIAVMVPRRPAWDAGERPGKAAEARQHLLTHSPERYTDEQWWRAARPEIVMGPASWGWLASALASAAAAPPAPEASPAR